jgi:hypothetical protein
MQTLRAEGLKRYNMIISHLISHYIDNPMLALPKKNNNNNPMLAKNSATSNEFQLAQLVKFLVVE